MIRRPLAPLWLIALALAGCGGSDASTGGRKAPDYAAALRGSPPRLAALHRQADELLPGGVAAFQKRLGELHGYPVVVNNWASWCGNCRIEFPLFQQQAAKQGTKIAFLGVDSYDNAEAAKTFLGERPVPYPSFSDPDWNISDRALPGQRALPKTAFYDSSGKRVYVHVGPYESEGDLRADIRRYAR